ncbi:vasa RNA helicase [Asbolus verrucosus]|uniref:RNA helicase n=1 Tax=Asbolus verrucosus TaxID=1661398 RepID=A0A482VS05_ASBVE|nr:vasa RNA helicase [Asbolus verrucosus]
MADKMMTGMTFGEILVQPPRGMIMLVGTLGLVVEAAGAVVEVAGVAVEVGAEEVAVVSAMILKMVKEANVVVEAGEEGDEAEDLVEGIGMKNLAKIKSKGKNLRRNENFTFLQNWRTLKNYLLAVTGKNVAPPISSFETSGLRAHLLENIAKSGYTKPTAIQKYSIPVILNGRDLMSCAQTGSGKTAAFLLPIIHNLLTNKNPPNTENNCAQPVVVIMSPTRELAIQIWEQGKKFAYNSTVKVAVAYGGTSTNHQRGKILGGCHILVATPGRLKDFVNRGYVSFASLQYFVLDEADRMLDMGFLGDVEEMLSHQSMPATGERQTLMFSATFPEEIQQLAAKFLHDYIFLAVGIVGSASTDVEQDFFQVSQYDKRPKLLSILEETPNDRTLIFVETKRNADFLATFLSEHNIQSTSIHGDRYQSEREQALSDFKKGVRKVLVATGVAARGLDIKDVQHVINYDLPNSIDEYVHRIGRTGRVGNRGRATSFFDDHRDHALAGSLAKILSQAKQKIPEWLGSRSHGEYADQFGGRDIRGDNFGCGQDFNSPPVVEEEEVW